MYAKYRERKSEAVAKGK